MQALLRGALRGPRHPRQKQPSPRHSDNFEVCQGRMPRARSDQRRPTDLRRRECKFLVAETSVHGFWWYLHWLVAATLIGRDSDYQTITHGSLMMIAEGPE
jgi:hypothetical protein